MDSSLYWVAAFGGGWILLGAAAGKLMRGTADVAWPTDRRRATLIGTLVLAEVFAGLLLLGPQPFAVPAAALFIGFAVVQAFMARRHPGLRCGCYGQLDEAATYSYVHAVVFLSLGLLLIWLSFGRQSLPEEAMADAITIRIAGAIIPLGALILGAVRHFYEVA